MCGSRASAVGGASELAANTLHAQAVAEAGGGGNRLASVNTDVEGEPVTSVGPAPHTHRPSRVPRYPQAPQPPRDPAAEQTVRRYEELDLEQDLICTR